MAGLALELEVGLKRLGIEQPKVTIETVDRRKGDLMRLQTVCSGTIVFVPAVSLRLVGVHAFWRACINTVSIVSMIETVSSSGINELSASPASSRRATSLA